MKIILGADFNAVLIKDAVKKMLTDEGHEVLDVGVIDLAKPIPYMDIAAKVATSIQKGEYDRGILFCGTGMGMAIIANKYKGIYAAVCESTYSAEKCRAINNANVLTMGGFMIGEKLACDMAKVFVDTNLGDGLEEFRKNNVKKCVPAVAAAEEVLFGCK
ncbi:MAG: RpiB/LacA/LacB family sugar-phosphate isomerase [Eubacteriales bacterium]